MSEPIAVLGIGCRYPQAEGVAALWKLLLEGRDAIGPYPGGRFRALDAEYAQAAEGHGKIATHLGGFLPAIDRFDAGFFGISPREAAFIDPQQRLLLEVSWDALEDAGQIREKYQGSRTGVFTGLWTTDYEQHLYRISEKPEFYMLTGGGRSTACGRVSFTYGFEGPSVSVDTACSSSMVAIHLACQSLRVCECEMALAGGVNVILASDVTRLFTNAGMLAPDGHCKFGDKSANGFVRSEGAGMVVLKRLSDAEAAGDPIYAVIRGSSVNNDGRTSGLMVTPSRVGQKQMILDAWAEAGATGADIAYIEAHGTGTHVGDPVEVGAIADALRAAGATERVPIGSMKSNVGHTESAAGVAGVIKAALVLHHQVIPPSLHCVEPNPEIDWAGSPIEMATARRELGPQVNGGLRMAGASSFGLTGTNAHMLLAEYAEVDARVESDARPSGFLLPLTGYTSEALRSNARRWMEFLESGVSGSDLAEVCYWAGARRTHLDHRFAAIGSDAAELRGQLEAFLAGEVSASPEAGVVGVAPVKVVFVAPGQGSQWDGMARELFAESEAFRESFTACDKAIAAETGWSLIERLDSADAATYLTEIDFVQPALFAMSVTLAAVWRAAGVVPGAVVGHSMGEVAAAHLAGILTLEDAAAVICRRSKLMRTLSGTGSGSGAMASVELPAAEVETWLRQFEGRVSIAAENSPRTTVVSGDAEAVYQLLEWLELKEIFCRRVKVDVASHSVLVDPILAELKDGLRGLKPIAGELPFFSTVNGAYTDGGALDAGYWVRNLREPVRLATATKALVADGFTCFVELSPHPIVVPALENTLRATAGDGAMALPSLLRGNAAWPVLLRSMGRFWIAGGRLDWGAIAGRGDGPVSRRFRLPDYAFETERFWQEEGGDSDVALAGAAKLSPLLRSRTDLANEPGTTLFEVIADLKSLPYVGDHRVGGAAVFPGSAHLEVALQAARVLWPEKTARLGEVEFLQALYLAENEIPEVQLAVLRLPGMREVYSFALRGRQGGGADTWTEHSKGMLWPVTEADSKPGAGANDPKFAGEDLAERSGTGAEMYRKAQAAGLDYGPAFQLVESYTSKRLDGVLMAQSRMHPADGAEGYLLHPATLDACFQTMILMRPRIAGLLAEDVYLPASLRELRIAELPAAEAAETLVTEAVFRGADEAMSELEFDLRLRTASGRLLVEACGMKIRRVDSQNAERTADDLYLLGWKPIRLPAAAMPGVAVGQHWLLFADLAADLAMDSSASRAAELARLMTGLGGRCTLVWPGERFRARGAGERRLDLLGADEYELPLSDQMGLDTLLELVAAEAGNRIDHVLDLWTLDDGEIEAASDDEVLEAVLQAQGRGVKFVPTLVQAITRAAWTQPPKLWLVTEGTQQVGEAVAKIRLAGSTVWGLGAVLIREHPELRPCMVDLSGDASELDGLVRLLLEASSKAVDEDRIALRGERGFVERVLPCALKMKADVPRKVAAGEAFRVGTERAGALDQLQFRVVEEVPPGADEVVVEIAYSGLNFIDVTKALGIYPGLDPKAAVQMGGECSGRVVALGASVEGLSVGDAVVAITPSPTRVGLLASRATLPAALVARVPAKVSLAEAGSLPIAYLTAHYSLNELARCAEGEWVLIHAGAGGVGLAAAKIALARGARVIATASSPEKHAFLHAWGVEHVLQSRTLEFAERVMEITGGRGVDIVLNSLAGDFIPASMEVLAAYGRFIELGKRDIYEDRRVGLKAFRKNIAYFAVDLAALIEERPAYAARLFREVMEAVGSGRWTPLPVTHFAANEVPEAFQFMVEARHIGKLAIRFEGMREEVRVLPSKTGAATLQQPRFNRDGSYIITGGLGGVGLTVAEWMAAKGAGCLVLVSRRSPSVEEHAAMERARASGACVEHRRTDLTDRQAVEALVAEIGQTMPPLRGIMHAAAVIDDALVMDMRPERFDAVLEPKVRGAWHLHEATRDLPLKFFVMFSSVATIFPQPGHGSYAAANAFLDSFAAYRRGLGLAASSINWTGWVGLGLARNTGTSRTIDACAAEGLGSFDYEEATAALWQALWADPIHATAVRIDEQMVAAQETIPTLQREIAGAGAERTRGGVGTAEHPALVELAAAGSHGEQMLLLEKLLRTETSRVLKLAPEKIGANQAFGQMGIDSLMALELIRRVNAALGLALPATAVFNYPTLTVLAAQILKRLGMDASAAVPSEPVAEERHHGGEALSEDEALRALMEPGDHVSGD
jgi:acyl transferase domain-containing protein/NADPH:quinone reductase-like Zn-dependent oxidoreductase/acyl carrier protein